MRGWNPHSLNYYLTPEGIVKHGCQDYLDAMGIFHFPINNVPIALPNGGFRRFLGMKGISDAVIIAKDNVIFLEYKAPKKKISIDQEIFRDNVLKHGGDHVHYSVVHSVDELETDLRSLGII